MPSFDVLVNKVVGAEVAHMQWCPTMDLLALVTSDSQLMVHRAAGWQRLFAYSGFDASITCVAWQPDGQVLALGHSDGTCTLIGVEEGRLLATMRTHKRSLTSFCWVNASELERGDVRESPYVCSLAGLFNPLAELPKQSAAQQHFLEEAKPQLDVELYKLLFEEQSSRAFDVAVTADCAALIHFAVHGRFSLGTLDIGSLPALEFGADPTLLSVKLAPALHALTVIVHTSAKTHALLPDGTRQEHLPGNLLLAFRTGQLTRAHWEIRALALSYMQCDALASRARHAIEAAGKLWADAATPLHTKMVALDAELKQAKRTGTVADQLAMLLACGVPAHPPCLQSFILRELQEADLSRIIKALSAAASAVLQILISQAKPALEMLIQRLSHLHGLSKWPYQFAALGLQPSRVVTALNGAISLTASTELLLVTVRRAIPEMHGFVSWLIRVHRKMRDEVPPSAEEAVPLDANRVAAFLLDPRHASCGGGLPFDPVSDLFRDDADATAGAPGNMPAGFDDDQASALSGMPPAIRLPAGLSQLEDDLKACFSPVAQHVSAGFQLHSCTSLDALSSHGLYDLVHSDVQKPVRSAGEASANAALVPSKGAQHASLFLASLQRDGTPLAEHGVQLVLFRARWSLQDSVLPAWEVCALGGCESPIIHAELYKDSVALLFNAAADGTVFALQDTTGLDFAPLVPSDDGSTGQVASLHARLGAMLQGGQLQLARLGDCDARGTRSRTFGRMEVALMALSPERGMVALATKGRRLILLDVEDDSDGNEDDGCDEEGGEEEEEDADEKGDEVNMDED